MTKFTKVLILSMLFALTSIANTVYAEPMKQDDYLKKQSEKSIAEAKARQEAFNASFISSSIPCGNITMKQWRALNICTSRVIDGVKYCQGCPNSSANQRAEYNKYLDNLPEQYTTGKYSGY